VRLIIETMSESARDWIRRAEAEGRVSPPVADALRRRALADPQFHPAADGRRGPDADHDARQTRMAGPDGANGGGDADEWESDAGSPGDKLGGYELNRPLARGGMGYVWTGEDLRLRREVAIKRLIRRDETASRRFIAEAQVTGQLDHPNIVPIYQLGFDESDRPFLAMKRIRGNSLADLIDVYADSDETSPDPTSSAVARAQRPPTVGEVRPDGGSSPRSRRDAGADRQETPDDPDQTIATAGPAPLAIGAGAADGPDVRVRRPGSTRRLAVRRPRPGNMADARIALLTIFLKVCDAVAYAHSRGVIHRDIKPANIMIGEYGEVLLVDWGLAKVRGAPDDDVDLRRDDPRQAESDSEVSGILDALQAVRHEPGESRREIHTDNDVASQTLEGTVKGTAAYMAPEQAVGRVSRLDERTDIYSLGAVLYELLTYLPPFEGRARDVLPLVARGEWVPPRDRAPERAIPAELDAVVRRAMHVRPEGRYPSAGELKADVEAFMAGRTVAAHAYSSLELARLWIRRNRQALTVAAVFLVVVTVGLAIGRIAMDRVVADTKLRDAAARQLELDRTLGELQERAVTLLTRYEAIAPAGPLRRGVVERALDAYAQWPGPQLRSEIRALASHPLLLEHRPEMTERVAALESRAAGDRLELVQDWAATELRRLDRIPPASVRPPDRSHAMELFDRFAADPAADLLPVAEFARWLVDAALAADDVRTAAQWTARAYLAQPYSSAAGRAFLRFADRAMAAEDADDGLWQQPREAAKRYFLALSRYGSGDGADPRVRAAAMIGLARSLAQSNGVLPFGTGGLDLPGGTNDLALRYLLRLVDPAGNARPGFAEVLTPAEAREAAALLTILRRQVAAVPGRLVDHDGDLIIDAAAEIHGRPGVVRLTPFDRGPDAKPGDPRILDFRGPIRERLRLAGLNPDDFRITGDEMHVTHLDFRALPAFVLTPTSGDGPDRLALFRAFTPVADACFIGFAGQWGYGDLDGDGYEDGVTFRQDGLYVGFQDETGLIGEPERIPIDDRTDPDIVYDLAAATTKILKSAEMVDMDGDGDIEVVLSVGEWEGFGFTIYDVTADRRLWGRAIRRFGMGPAAVTRDADGRLIIEAFSHLAIAHQGYFYMRGVPDGPPPNGYSRWRFDPATDRIEQLPPPAGAEPYLERATRVVPLDADGWRGPVVAGGWIGSLTSGLGTVAVLRRSDEPDDAPPVVARTSADRHLHSARDGRFTTTIHGHAPIRRMSDRELAYHARLPLPPPAAAARSDGNPLLAPAAIPARVRAVARGRGAGAGRAGRRPGRRRPGSRHRRARGRRCRNRGRRADRRPAHRTDPAGCTDAGGAIGQHLADRRPAAPAARPRHRRGADRGGGLRRAGDEPVSRRRRRRRRLARPGAGADAARPGGARPARPADRRRRLADPPGRRPDARRPVAERRIRRADARAACRAAARHRPDRVAVCPGPGRRSPRAGPRFPHPRRRRHRATRRRPARPRHIADPRSRLGRPAAACRPATLADHRPAGCGRRSRRPVARRRRSAHRIAAMEHNVQHRLRRGGRAGCRRADA
jgi:serine/threonine protein kinase